MNWAFRKCVWKATSPCNVRESPRIFPTVSLFVFGIAFPVWIFYSERATIVGMTRKFRKLRALCLTCCLRRSPGARVGENAVAPSLTAFLDMLCSRFLSSRMCSMAWCSRYIPVSIIVHVLASQHLKCSFVFSDQDAEHLHFVCACGCVRFLSTPATISGRQPLGVQQTPAQQ